MICHAGRSHRLCRQIPSCFPKVGAEARTRRPAACDTPTSLWLSISSPKQPAQFPLQARLHVHTLLITMMEREAVPYMSAEPPFCHAVAPTGAMFLSGRGRGGGVGGSAGKRRRRPRYCACACGVGLGCVRRILRMDQNRTTQAASAAARPIRAHASLMTVAAAAAKRSKAEGQGPRRPPPLCKALRQAMPWHKYKARCTAHACAGVCLGREGA